MRAVLGLLCDLETKWNVWQEHRKYSNENITIVIVKHAGSSILLFGLTGTRMIKRRKRVW